MSRNLHPITMPKWGLAMKEGSIIKWFKEIGDEIKKGENLVEIETEKVVNEMESPESGTLLKKCIEEDVKVNVGSLIAIYGDSSVSDKEIEKFISEFNENLKNEENLESDDLSQSEKIKLDNIEINFVNLSNDKQKNLLFIHGFGGDLNNWMFNQEELSKDYNTFALDLPGHGLSSKNIKESSLTDFSELIIKFCEEHKLNNVNLVGHSFGAGIAINCAFENMNYVESLNLISPIGLGDEIDSSYLENFITADSRKELKHELEKLYFNSEILTRDLINEVLKYKRIDGVSNSLNLIKDEILASGKQKINLKEKINKISIPVTVIWGKEDSIIPFDHSKNLNEKINIKIIDQCGHMGHTEHPNEVNVIIKDTISK